MERFGNQFLTIVELYHCKKVKFSIIHKNKLLSYVLSMGSDSHSI